MKSMEKSRIALRELLNQYTPHADRLAQVEEELNSNVGNPTKISILLQERKLKRSLELWLEFWIDKHYLIKKPVEDGETPWSLKQMNS